MKKEPEYVDLADRCGRLLFGKPSRFRLGMWISTLDSHGQRTFCQAEYRDWINDRELPWRPVAADLKRFCQLEMLRERFDIANRDHYGRRARWWTRLESPLWDMYLIASIVVDEHVEFSTEKRRQTIRELMALRDSLHQDRRTA